MVSPSTLKALQNYFFKFKGQKEHRIINKKTIIFLVECYVYNKKLNIHRPQ